MMRHAAQRSKGAAAQRQAKSCAQRCAAAQREAREGANSKTMRKDDNASA